jgi:hypothetical protein
MPRRQGFGNAFLPNEQLNFHAEETVVCPAVEMEVQAFRLEFPSNWKRNTASEEGVFTRKGKRTPAFSENSAV